MRARGHAIPALCLALLMLAGCGWQLRGTPAFTGLDSLTLEGGSRVLRHHLTRELGAAEVPVHDHAPWRLVIEDERWQRRTIAVDNQGRAAEVAVNLELSWQLRHGDSDKAAAPRRSLRISRSFHYNPDSAVAASDEEELLRQSLYQDAVWQMLRQLEATASRLPAAEEQSGEPEA